MYVLSGRNVHVRPLCYFGSKYTSSTSAWWRHQMETYSALLAICAGNSPVSGEFPAQRPVTQSFDIFFDLRLNKRLIKQSWGWSFETLSWPLWRQCNGELIKTPTPYIRHFSLIRIVGLFVFLCSTILVVRTFLPQFIYSLLADKWVNSYDSINMVMK